MAGKNKEEFIRIAVWYYKTGLYKKTIEACEKALALDPNYITPYYGIGKSLMKLNKYHDALDVYNKALEVKETKELYSQRGDLYHVLKDYVCASNDYYRALVLDPEDEELKQKKAKVNKYVDQTSDPSKQAAKEIEWDYESREMDEEYFGYMQDWNLYAYGMLPERDPESDDLYNTEDEG